MEWWRFYNGAWNDAKLLTVTRRTGAPLSHAVSLLVTVLDHASRESDRGYIGNYNLEVYAEALGISMHDASRIWHEFSNVGIIHEDRVKNWQKRQPSHDPTAAERQRRKRLRDNPVTVSHGESRSVTTEEKRIEKKREDRDSPSGNSGLRVSTEDVTKAIDNWNTMAERLGLAAVRDRTEQRKKAVAMRLKQFGGLVAWNEALCELADQPFCCGENERGWKATFDWFLKPASLAKIREGAYRREQQP